MLLFVRIWPFIYNVIREQRTWYIASTLFFSNIQKSDGGFI